MAVGFDPVGLVHRRPSHLAVLPDTAELYATNSGILLSDGMEIRTLFRHAAAFIDDPAQCNMFGFPADANYESPPVFVSSMMDASLIGYRAAIKDNWFTTDEWFSRPEYERAFLDNIGQPNRFLNEDTGFIAMGGNPEEYIFDGRDVPRRELGGVTLFLGSHEPTNYGSFLFRVLSKMTTVRSLALDYDQAVFWTHPSFVRLAEMVGIPASRIVAHDPGTLTQCERVLIPSLRNPHAYLDPESRALMLELSNRYRRTDSPTHVYISRSAHGARGGNTRICMNEPELEEALGKRGFAIVDLESLSNEEQIALFAGADMIVGPSGSGMFNCVFAREGARIIDIESEPHWIYAHMGLFASCGLRYGIVTGQVDETDPRPVHRNWRVDVDAVIERACTDW